MPKGNNNKRMERERERQLRMNVIAPLWKKNWTLSEMREECMRVLGLPTYSMSTVHSDVKKLIKEWKEERVVDTDEKVTAELARLDLVIKEAWEMWEKSKVDFRRKRQTKVGVPSNNTMNTIRALMVDDEERGKGDPRYLDVILKALDQRRKLLGIDKTSVDINGTMQGVVEVRYVGDDTEGISESEDEVRERDGITG